MNKKLIMCAFIITVLLPAIPIRAQVFDFTELLSEAEETRLTMKIEEIKAAYDFGLIILTVDTLEGQTPIDYSWGLLDYVGLSGENWDGCLLLQSTGERDYALTASGRGSTILNPAAYNKLEKDVVSCLRRDDYIGAYEFFIRDWEKFLVLESQGKRYNFLRETTTHMFLLIGAWVLALVIGLLVIHFMKAQMNTALPAKEADTYIIPGSLVITRQHDKFLYSTTTKTQRQQPPSSGGGSSMSGGGRSSRSGKY
jgi:uncharacterized membrane protein YgcG